MSKYIEKYPWLRLMSLYTGKIYSNHDAMDDMPEGWLLAFGDLMLGELDEAIKAAGVEDSFVVLQVKEKFGSLVFRHNQPKNSEIDIIIRKYSTISRFVCIRCGHPDIPLVASAWFRPMDKNCYIKTEHTNGSEYEEFTKESPSEIPTSMIWEEFERYDEENKKAIYKKFEVDISETVEKVRRHWKKRVADGTHIVEESSIDKTYSTEEVFKMLKEDLEEKKEDFENE